jgi:hypothetical protein
MDEKKLRKKFGKQYGYEVLFKNQPKHAKGKTGVILGEMGMPEDYEPEFYSHFMAHVFNYTLPSFLVRMILADKGIGLIDPDNPIAREEFKPKQLIDSGGSFTNKAGVPYVDCKYKWVKANKKNTWDHGYFLYKGDGPNGFPDVCDKVGAKVVGWYYGRLLPEKKVSWRSQMRRVYEESVKELSNRFPGAEFRSVYYMYPETIQKAVEELIAAGCETIIYQNFNCSVYSDFEDYGHSLIKTHEYAAGRATVILGDQIGNQASLRDGYCQMLRDQLTGLKNHASVLVILSKHGHPFKKDTQDERAPLFRTPLEECIRAEMSHWKGKWEVVWSSDEYADEYWDPSHSKFGTHDAYHKAVNEGFDYAIELPTEFMAENTDLMIFHAMKKFTVFPDYDCYAPVPYPDWEKPLVRTFHEGKTTAIYAGCPVGPYRKYVVGAVVGSVSDVLKDNW